MGVKHPKPMSFNRNRIGCHFTKLCQQNLAVFIVKNSALVLKNLDCFWLGKSAKAVTMNPVVFSCLSLTDMHWTWTWKWNNAKTLNIISLLYHIISHLISCSILFDLIVSE